MIFHKNAKMDRKRDGCGGRFAKLIDLVRYGMTRGGEPDSAAARVDAGRAARSGADRPY